MRLSSMHRLLEPAFVGSNPTASAIFQVFFSRNKSFNNKKNKNKKRFDKKDSESSFKKPFKKKFSKFSDIKSDRKTFSGLYVSQRT